MVETCTHCGSRVLFTGDTCPSCGITRGAAQEITDASTEDTDKYQDIIFDGLWDKQPDSQIVSSLVDAGCSEDLARKLLSDERRKKTTEAQASASDLAKQGWIIAGIGVVVTAGTYLSAVSSDTGGVYVVAWGAILYGIIQVIRGSSGAST